MGDIPSPFMDAYGLPTGFFIGLDLGMRRDHSALIINEKRVMEDGGLLHAIRFAQRWKLGTEYYQVARETAEIISELPDRPEPPQLWADSTGVGGPVMAVLKDQGLSPFEVTLTAGANWSLNPVRRVSLPKSILASTLNVVLQNRMIAIAADLPFLDQLRRELGTFTVSKTAGGVDSFNSRTEADHDDMVVSLGLAVFAASRNWQTRRTAIL